jgi:hypothetical protein
MAIWLWDFLFGACLWQTGFFIFQRYYLVNCLQIPSHPYTQRRYRIRACYKGLFVRILLLSVRTKNEKPWRVVLSGQIALIFGTVANLK